MHKLRALKIICRARDVEPDMVLGASRKYPILLTRMIVMAYLYNKMKVKGYELAELFGRERVNCLRSIRTLRNLVLVDKDVRDEWERIKEIMKKEGF